MAAARRPWRNWYHCMGNTYGTWPLGDGRGFRTRHHRWHVEGDYRFPPPPGYYERLLERSRGLMRRRPVVLDRDVRRAVCGLFAGALRHYGVEVAALSLSGMHFHLVARFVPVGCDPYEHLGRIGIKLTHERRRPTPGGRGRSGGGRSGGSLSAYDVDPAPRRILGLARSWVSHEVKRMGLMDAEGGLWGKRPLCLPVSERGHQVAAVRYVCGHEKEGAAVVRPARMMKTNAPPNAHALRGVGD